MFNSWSTVGVSLLLASVAAQAPAATNTPARPTNSTTPATNSTTPANNGTTPSGNSTTIPSNTTAAVSLGPLATATPVGLVNITAIAPGYTQVGSGIVTGPGDGYIASDARRMQVGQVWMGMGLVVLVGGGGLIL